MNERVESIAASVAKLISDKVVSVNYYKKWYNENLRELKFLRNSAQQRAGYTESNEDWVKYRHLRNKYNSELNRCRDEEISDQIKDNCRDPKRLWKILKRHIKVKENTTRFVEFCDLVLSDESQIASVFKRLFCTQCH